MTKSNPTVLEDFCRALAEADSVYQYLAVLIREADVTSVSNADVVDSGDVFQKQGTLVKTVLDHSSELMKLNEEYRRQIEELTERNEILERRQSYWKTLEGSGFTEKNLLQFVDVFVLAKNIRENDARGAEEIFPYPGILKTLSQDQLKACLLSIYIVQHVVMAKCRYDLPDSVQRYSLELKNIVDAQLKAHPHIFNDAVENLHISEMNGLNTFDAVADEMFLDGVCNWGRVIAWFVFCASLAKKFPDTTSPDTLDFYAVFSWYYIDSRMCNWIVQAGGWVRMMNFYFM